MHKAGIEIKEKIKRYKNLLLQMGVAVERVILFGSYARSKNREGSDIDIVVVSNDFEKMNLRERIEILGIAAARIMEPIEALGYTSKELKSVPRTGFIREAIESGLNV